MSTIIHHHHHHPQSATTTSPEAADFVSNTKHHQALLVSDDEEQDEVVTTRHKNYVSSHDSSEGLDNLFHLSLDGPFGHCLDPVVDDLSCLEGDYFCLTPLPDLSHLSSSDASSDNSTTTMEGDEETPDGDRGAQEDTSNSTSKAPVIHQETETFNPSATSHFHMDQVDAPMEDFHLDAQQLIPDMIVDQHQSYHSSSIDAFLNHYTMNTPPGSEDGSVPTHHDEELEAVSSSHNENVTAAEHQQQHENEIDNHVDSPADKETKDGHAAASMNIAAVPNDNTISVNIIHQDQKQGTHPIHKDNANHEKIIICERGGKSNNNPGNQEYLRIIEGKKHSYRAIVGNTYQDRKRKTSFIKDTLREFNNDGFTFVGRKEDW
eukprot:CAMPEP_0195293544 /NCGR_PEP_ID=MMETSP0707-20130614/12726_1 /TAXON_ID=33640 /ORGANISM="Asterionellopsis glacialis, Strain CCMP134" /LENGTH=376 /DNA_ID=CAMNT_0040354285 /DNA_START=54 /DNA_END=1181 /DNA_ORIENTATION=-